MIVNEIYTRKDAEDLDKVLNIILSSRGKSLNPDEISDNLLMSTTKVTWCIRRIEQWFKGSLVFHYTEEGPFIVIGEFSDAKIFYENGGFKSEFERRQKEVQGTVNVNIGSNHGQVVTGNNNHLEDIRSSHRPINIHNVQSTQPRKKSSSIWKLMSNNPIISFIITIITGLIVVYLAYKFGWN